MAPKPVDLVFVHGWSVTHTRDYGGLPERLVGEARSLGLVLQARHVYLGRYISFHDEVRVADIAAAMQAAVEDHGLGRAGRFFCVTHSTGGPVVREWFDRFYARTARKCPMSHLVMLAPANFGSALAQLGKGRLGRISAWFGGTEPGQQVLNWLELGSAQSLELARTWVQKGDITIGPAGHFPFVITGQQIDRKAYDNLNSYTGEIGSDGVVRVAAANLRSTYVRLEQHGEVGANGYNRLRQVEHVTGPAVPMRIVGGKSHSGTTQGIMRSVKKKGDQRGASKDTDTVQSILRCFQVRTRRDYDRLATVFASETDTVQAKEQVEVEDRVFLSDRTFIHDRYSQVIFRVTDTEGHAVHDFDLLMTAGDASDPNHLPERFFCDRQRNQISLNTVTYYLNYDVMSGCAAVNGVREALDGMRSLGFMLRPRPEKGLVTYRRCAIGASIDLFNAIIRPNQTTLVDVVITRMVDKETFRLERTLERRGFKSARPSGDTVN